MSPNLPQKRLVGYADRMSLRPGERIAFMVSSEADRSYRAEIVRLISGDLHPEGAGLIEEPVASPIEGFHPGRRQEIHAGSYALLEDGGGFALESFSLQATIWPTKPAGGRQTLLGQWSAAGRSGWALILEESGALALELGDGNSVVRVASGRPLLEREWALVAAGFDAESGAVRLYQEPLASVGRAPAPHLHEERVALAPRCPAGLPFAIAASVAPDAGGGLRAADHFNGKIEAPRVAEGLLPPAEREALRHPGCRLPPAVLAAWDFSAEMTGERVLDRSAHRRHGRLVNLPTRAMKGSTWSGASFDWKAAPQEYGAIHFHEDDLYDAGWAADFALTLPGDLRSGVYAAKLTAGAETEYLPFVVRPAAGRRAEAVVLLPTASYLAYANERIGFGDGGFLHAYANRLVTLSAADLWLDAHPEAGASLYDLHSDGSGVHHSSRLRPILNFRPGCTSTWVGSPLPAPWQFNADLALIHWLERQGIAYDVITDEDLHEEGLAEIAPYRALMTGSHPEYYSKEMYDALTAYLERGGRLLYLGGNGFYWRVAFHRSLPGVIELRRAEDGIRDWVAEGGEYYHAFTGEYGGMWSRMGRPIHALVGVGMAAQGFDTSSYYRRTAASRDPRAAFVFAGVEEEIVGDFGTVGGGAAGLELDRCDGSLGSPPHTLVLASSERHSDTYFPPPEEIHSASAMMDGRQNPAVRADLAFFETPAGGAVFSTGSIAWIGSLSHAGGDNNVSRITRNVLLRFLDPTPFVHPDRAAPST